eukprot:2025922-Pleurochrysis_carterae.AAC.1
MASRAVRSIQILLSALFLPVIFPPPTPLRSPTPAIVRHAPAPPCSEPTEAAADSSRTAAAEAPGRKAARA